MLLGHDFQSSNLRQTAGCTAGADVDYNGWWMSLIPTRIIREIGLSLPVFIKWDDAEYALRAKEHGYPTVSMPGAAVWHVSWIDKDDLVGWQAYFHARNRFIAALIHSPYEFGGRVVRESHYADIKHLVSMQYATARGRNMALRDLLQGPGQLHDQLDTKLPEIRDMMKSYPDSVIATDPDTFPAAKLDKPPKHGHGVRAAEQARSDPYRGEDRAAPAGAARCAVEQWSGPRRMWLTRTTAGGACPSMIPPSSRTPKALALHGTNVTRSSSGQMLAESARLHALLLKDWKKLSAEYKAALPEITSIETWKKTFERTQRPCTMSVSTEELARPGVGGGLAEVFRTRFLLKLLVRKELKVRYRGSVLGLLWSYVKPGVQFIVFYIALGVFLGWRTAPGTRAACPITRSTCSPESC